MSLREAVARHMDEVAAEHIMPRFRKLASDEIEEKAPGDLVTEADKQAEAALAPRLTGLLPGSLVVGEEAVANDPTLITRMERDETLWVIDPVDGTKNFVDGKPEFASMIALIKAGETVGAWIWFPVSRVLVSAGKAEGAYRRDGANETRLNSASSPALGKMRGAISTGFMPEPWKHRVTRFGERAGHLHSHFCAACEYRDIAGGEKDFAAFYRMLPWDHAPGALILTEAGGIVRSLETGKNYAPRTLEGPHVLARDEAGWQAIAAAIAEAP